MLDSRRTQNLASKPLDTCRSFFTEPFLQQNEHRSHDLTPSPADETILPSDWRFPGYVQGIPSTIFDQGNSTAIEDYKIPHAFQGIPVTKFARFPWLNPGLSVSPPDGKESPSYQQDTQLSPKQPGEAEGPYSLSDCLYNFQQNNIWGQASYIPPYHYQPRPDTNIIPDTGTGASRPLFHPGLTYKKNYESPDKSGAGGALREPKLEGNDVTSPETERFRFRTTLQTPTAMMNECGDQPLTYLNKGQVYYLTVMDTAPPVITDKMTTYRTFVRTTFDQEQARSNPAACWQLWKEGRGASSGQQQDETLFALEYAGGDSPQFQIEHKGFDGFSVTWSIDSTARFSSCHIPLCFNFLSTDFTRSKGVRGSPVRLCAKTEQVASDNITPPESEVCFCKIQVFRDHGAERKLSNDHSNLEKAIDKLRQRISYAELGWGSRKRKRGRSMTSAKDLKPFLPDDETEQLSQTGLRSKLVGFEKMAQSARSKTLLSLRGDKEDDPDLYPVRLEDVCIKVGPVEIAADPSTQSTYSESVSPRSFSVSDKDTTAASSVADGLMNEPIRVNRVDLIDQVPTSRHLTSIACFYVRLSEEELHEYYRAIYLSERTIQELVRKISDKYRIRAMDCVNLFHINGRGLKIMVDDEFVQQMIEGQHMRIEFHQSTGEGDGTGVCEMWLFY